MMNHTYSQARAFLYRNARPLDIARFQYHFEGGSQTEVLTALATYQNADGGFAHALEADAWNPNSTPIQTWASTEILREIGFTDRGHPIVQGVLRYLADGQDFTGHFWHNAVRSNNDFPHAPWWRWSDDSAEYGNYNPTASLAGFILRFANRDSELFTLGLRIAKEAIDAYMAGGLLDSMHRAVCYVHLLDYAEGAGITDAFDIAALKEKLLLQVKHNITADKSAWETGYICRPSQFINSRDSIFYTGNEELADYECEFIVKSQLPDGSWSITWAWSDYPEEWAISKNWWKSNGANLNLLYLRGMGKLSDDKC